MEKEARRAVMTVVKELKKGGIIIISKLEFKVQNIVASVSLRRKDRVGTSSEQACKNHVSAGAVSRPDLQDGRA